jgi:uncharacterized phage-associated protein
MGILRLPPDTKQIASMVSAHDVAAYILREKGLMSVWRLQKLVYYSQAWHLVWDRKPLISEKIEAWANGPVVRALYEKHRSLLDVSAWPWGDPEALAGAERTTVDGVLSFYGHQTGHWLSELTHEEAPWTAARAEVEPGERGAREIALSAMREYYSSH